MVMATTNRGKKLCEAADFLVELLAGKEMPVTYVYQLANESGISKTTLERAKGIAGVKSRKTKDKWFMWVPEDMAGRIFSIPKPPVKEILKKAARNYEISRDWVSVRATNDGVSSKIDIPLSRSQVGGLRVKVHGYEFEADENFPPDKLIEFLKKLNIAEQYPSQDTQLGGGGE